MCYFYSSFRVYLQSSGFTNFVIGASAYFMCLRLYVLFVECMIMSFAQFYIVALLFLTSF